MDHTTKQDQEHGVYGKELPNEGDTVSKVEAEDIGNTSFKGFENMKKNLKEIEEYAGALREMQAEVEKMMGSNQEDSSSAYVTQTEKEKADARTIYIGNVDHACTLEEVQQHFQSCGTISRVTIPTDKFGQPKGFAYVEFFELESVKNSLLLNESELKGRQIKVTVRPTPKRINVSVMKQFRGRQCSLFMSGSRGVQKGARGRSKLGQRCPEKALPGPVHSLIKAARKRRGPARKPPLKPSPLRPPDFKG